MFRLHFPSYFLLSGKAEQTLGGPERRAHGEHSLGAGPQEPRAGRCNSDRPTRRKRDKPCGICPARIAAARNARKPVHTTKKHATAGRDRWQPGIRRALCMVAGSLPADVSGAVPSRRMTTGVETRLTAAQVQCPPSAHAERTFNHTPNAHGDVTQRQSAGFASRKLSVQIASSPPIPKCPSLRGWQWLKCLCLGHGAATSWQRRGRRAGRCASLKRAKTDHVSCGSRRMPDLPNRSPTVHCARSCTLRQVPRSLPGRQGNALYGEDVTAFEGCGNRILERCEYPPRSPRLRDPRPTASCSLLYR